MTIYVQGNSSIMLTHIIFFNNNTFIKIKILDTLKFMLTVNTIFSGTYRDIKLYTEFKECPVVPLKT